VNQPDPGSAGATGLLENTDAPSVIGSPETQAATIPVRLSAAPPRVRILVRQGLVALGMTGGHGPKSSNWQALAHPKYRWYFIGSVTSNFGTWIQNTAQVVLAYQLTHSVFAVGLVTCAQFTSPLLLGPWAAVLTHRVGNWRALIVTQVASTAIAATLAALKFSGALTINWLFAGALAIGLAFTFALPAMSVMVASLFSGDENELDRTQVVRRAMAMDSVSYNLGRALAPAISILVFTTVGFGMAFALNACSFFLFTLVLVYLRPRASQHAPNRSRVMNGLHIAVREPRVMVLLMMVAAITVAADPILVLGPALAGHIFRTSADWSGVFIAALGAGNVIGSFRPSKRRPPSIRRAAAVLAMLALAMMVFSAAPSIWLSIAAAFGVGMACLVAGATARSLLIECAGDDVKRQTAIMAAWAVAWAGSKPIASLADGSLAGLIGVRATGILLAAPALLPALVLILLPWIENLACAARWSAWLNGAKGIGTAHT
jgi:MFS family permease